MHTESTKKKLAVVYHGIPRSIEYIYKSHTHHISNALKRLGIETKTFIHFWKIENNVQKVWNRVCKADLDPNTYELLSPDYYKTEPQDIFLSKIDFSDYFYEDVYNKYGAMDKENGEWNPDLLRNHICALESMKRAYNMVTQSGYTPDYIALLRPDIYLKRALLITPEVKILDSDPRSILIPGFDFYEGVNDRAAVMNFEMAEPYFNRINFIKDYRKNHGRIVSEKYTKYICDNYYNKTLTTFRFSRVHPTTGLARD